MATNNSHYTTIIDKNTSSIEITEYISFLGKTLYTTHRYESNLTGKYQIGISFLSGIRKFRINIPQVTKHLSAYELQNFHEFDNPMATQRSFTIVLMHGDIIEDDIQPNDSRYKGKTFGSPIGNVDQYEEILPILQLIEDYVPIEIIRPIKHSLQITGLYSGKYNEEPTT